MSKIRRGVLECQQRGFAVCWIKPGHKGPKYLGWQLRGKEVEDFRPGDNMGILTGPLSDVVCADLDDRRILAAADKYLPRTRMVEGRPGKPRSHRFYRLANVPDELTAGPYVAGGMGGPQSRQFDGPHGRLLDLLATGRQAVVAPSLWISQDGKDRERRVWHQFDEPAVVDCWDFYDRVFRLAESFGWTGKRLRRVCQGRRTLPACLSAAGGDCVVTLPVASDASPLADWRKSAKLLLGKWRPAIQGEGGAKQTYTVACCLIESLSPITREQAFEAMMRFYSPRCQPDWLGHMEEMADVVDNAWWTVRGS